MLRRLGVAVRTAGLRGTATRSRPFAPSLDRIDRHKPYRRDNVRLVVSIANFAMNAWGDEPLLQLASALQRKHGDSAAAVNNGAAGRRPRRCGDHRYGTGRDRPWDAHLSAPPRHESADPGPAAARATILS